MNPSRREQIASSRRLGRQLFDRMSLADRLFYTALRAGGICGISALALALSNHPRPAEAMSLAVCFDVAICLAAYASRSFSEEAPL